METNGQTLKKIRKSLGLSQEETGNLCNMNKSQISKLENDLISNPNIYIKVFSALGYKSETTIKPNSFPYTTKDILKRLAYYKKQHTHSDEIETLGLYGSCARNEQRTGSDIDIAIKLKKPNLLRLISIENELKELFTVETNVVSLTSKFLPGFLEEITKDIIYV